MVTTLIRSDLNLLQHSVSQEIINEFCEIFIGFILRCQTDIKFNIK